jgi:hypothetical protein
MHSDTMRCTASESLVARAGSHSVHCLRDCALLPHNASLQASICSIVVVMKVRIPGYASLTVAVPITAWFNQEV